jgi:hypothetical protein
MRALILVHRWLGIAFCLLFAMWFVSGIVMHFVPFPGLTETERMTGLAPVELSRVVRGPAEAVQASGINDAARVRLLQRSDGPVYVVSGASGVIALHADELGDAGVRSEQQALAVAVDHARRRGLDVAQAGVAELIDVDQWTVSGSLDRHRPLYRIALNDVAGTELYVSSTTGEVVRDTTRRERGWNYVGSVAHWIYPTVLRSRPALWNTAVWTLSLVASISAIAGSVLGLLRLRVTDGGLVTPYQGWHAWHHVLGLMCTTFVLSFIISGWLSMDSGRLFSTGGLSRAESEIIAGRPAWESLPAGKQSPIFEQAREVEWFAFDRRFYRRERTELATQKLLQSADANEMQPRRAYLDRSEVAALVGHMAPGCDAPIIVGSDDHHAAISSVPNAPVYRSVCGDVWFHIDGADGAVLERLDSSRRAYRWLYRALHTMDIPLLTSRPALRGALIVIMCGFGLLFSLTGAVIGWRRIRLHVSATGSELGR